MSKKPNIKGLVIVLYSAIFLYTTNKDLMLVLQTIQEKINKTPSSLFYSIIEDIQLISALYYKFEVFFKAIVFPLNMN